MSEKIIQIFGDAEHTQKEYPITLTSAIYGADGKTLAETYQAEKDARDEEFDEKIEDYDATFNSETARRNAAMATIESEASNLQELSLKVNELDEAVNGGSTSVTDITNSFVFTNNKILYASGSNFGKAATNSAGTFKAFGYADAVSLADYVGQKIRITLPYYKKSDGSQTTAGIVFYSAKSVESAVKGYQMPLGDIAPNTIEITIEENYKYLAACYLMDTSVVGAFKCEVVQSVSGGGLVDKVADLEDTTESIEEKMPLKFTPCNKALGAICFTWDDGSVEDDLVYEKFKAKGAKCGFSLIANATFISESGRNKTYKKYQSEGFSCFSHSSNTKTSEEVDEATFKANVLTARKNLESVGITANGFVYPGNKWAYSDYLGSMHGYLFGEGSTTPNTHETPLNRVKRCEIESKTEERIKEIIDDVCTNGGLVAFYGHAARIGTTGYNNMAFYETIIDYIKAKVDAGQCYFDSPDRVIKYYFGL